MTLFEKLKLVKSEEDVKDIYIKALGLRAYSKNLIDIQTDEIWFEAKDNYKLSTYAMFTQLLHYVQQARNKGEKVPPFLAVVDTQKAAIMKTEDVLPLLDKRNIKWGKRASDVTPEALEVVSQFIGTHLVSFKIETQEEEFIKTFKDAIQKGEIIRIQITPDNYRHIRTRKDLVATYGVIIKWKSSYSNNPVFAFVMEMRAICLFSMTKASTWFSPPLLIGI